MRAGTTGLLATLAYRDMNEGISAPLDDFATQRRGLAADVVLGVHLEGPYMNAKYGARTFSARLRSPDPNEYLPILQRPDKLVRMWSFAPELPGAIDFADAAWASGVVLGAGHSEAAGEVLLDFMKRGVRVAIHWSNATGTTPAAPLYA
ncbi:MAG: hypothetical protein ACREF9_19410, partial [Opitutaceae bacterium]